MGAWLGAFLRATTRLASDWVEFMIRALREALRVPVKTMESWEVPAAVVMARRKSPVLERR